MSFILLFQAIIEATVFALVACLVWWSVHIMNMTWFGSILW